MTDLDVAPWHARGALRARATPVRAVRRLARRATVEGAGERALAVGALASSVVAALSIATGLPAPVRFVAVLAFLCLAPGAAVLLRLGGRPEPGLILGAGLGISTVLAQSMLWLGAWQPKAFLYGLAAVCSASVALQLTGRRREATALERVRAAATSISAATVAHVALVVAALGLWGVSLTGADLGRISGVGLLSALPPVYYVAFGLLLAGGGVALTRQRLSPVVLGLYVIALVLVVHGTTPLLYDEPRYPWVYKHIAVIDLIARTGHVDRATDIYNNWPGFFALNAWISKVSGLSALAYAAWAQVFFNLAYAAAVRFAMRGVTGNDRVAWVATWLFVLGNWVAQDYLAPQAFAFLLALVLVGLCLRCSPWPVRPRSRAGRWWVARLDGFRAAALRRPAVSEPLPPAPLSPRAALVVGAPCYLAVVVSHQLTPVILLAGVTALAVFARRVPLWIPAAMALVEASWIALSWTYLNGHYDLFNIDPTSSGAPAGYRAGHGLSGVGLVMDATHVEVVLLAALAVAGLVYRLRARRWDLPAVVLIVAPVFVVALQSYSGEGRYRAYLFALPWLCYLAATSYRTVMRSSRLRAALSRVRLLLVTGALGACLLFGYFGLEMSNRVTPSDVAAGVWFDQHAPANSLVVEVASDSVSRVTARYATVFNANYPGAPTLTDQAQFRGRKLGTADLPAIEATLRGYGVPHTYLVVNGAEERFAQLYGILPDGWASSLTTALQASGDFRVVYHRGDAWIFQYAGKGA